MLTRIDVAFSRDAGRKVYVQHRLRRAGGATLRLARGRRHVYVCGDATHMAPDVHAALIGIVAEQGGLGREARRANICAACSATAATSATSTEHDRMTSTLKDIDRSRDVSQPLDKLGPDETLKADSDYLRGTIATSLADRITGAVAGERHQADEVLRHLPAGRPRHPRRAAAAEARAGLLAS